MTDLFICATLFFHTTILIWMWMMYKAQRNIYELIDKIIEQNMRIVLEMKNKDKLK